MDINAIEQLAKKAEQTAEQRAAEAEQAQKDAEAQREAAKKLREAWRLIGEASAVVGPVPDDVTVVVGNGQGVGIRPDEPESSVIERVKALFHAPRGRRMRDLYAEFGDEWHGVSDVVRTLQSSGFLTSKAGWYFGPLGSTTDAVLSMVEPLGSEPFTTADVTPDGLSSSEVSGVLSRAKGIKKRRGGGWVNVSAAEPKAAPPKIDILKRRKARTLREDIAELLSKPGCYMVQEIADKVNGGQLMHHSGETVGEAVRSLVRDGKAQRRGGRYVGPHGMSHTDHAAQLVKNHGKPCRAGDLRFDGDPSLLGARMCAAADRGMIRALGDGLYAPVNGAI